MTKRSSQFDLIIFGATAFTGKIASEYVAQNFPSSVRWAISGRNPEKLKNLHETLSSRPNPPQKYFVLDHSDRAEVFDLVGTTRVALSFAGPFERYGENVIASCAELGTHYLDITGEAGWVQKMIGKYEKSAKESGSILIPFSGFDSIPSDMGTWKVTQIAQKNHPQNPVTEVVSLFTAKGGINGGTFETLMDSLEKGKKENDLYVESSALVPEDMKGQFSFSDPTRPFYLKELNLTAPPFFMAPINSRVVYRSQAIRMKQSSKKQNPFRYVELQKVPRKFSSAQAWTMVLAGDLIKEVGNYRLGRKFLRVIGPRPGQGPSEKTQNSGFFKAQFYAYSHDKLVGKTEISFQGDPGNKATVALACESAQCLLSSQKESLPVSGGFWTPSTALGGRLEKRLLEAGFRIQA